MFTLAKRYRIFNYAIIIILVLSLIQVFVDFLIPHFTGEIIAVITNSSASINLSLAVKYFCFMLLTLLLSLVLSFFNGYVTSRIVNNIASQIRYDIYKKILDLSPKTINSIGNASLLTRNLNDVSTIAGQYYAFFRSVLYGPCLIVGALGFFIYYGCDWRMSIIIFFSVVIVSILIVVLMRLAYSHFESIEKDSDNINLITKENVAGVRVLRAYNADDYLSKRFAKINSSFTSTVKITNRIFSFVGPLTQLISSATTLFIVLISAVLVVNKSKSFNYSLMNIMIQYGGMMLSGFISTFSAMSFFPKAYICNQRILEILNSNDLMEINEKHNNCFLEKGKIEFKNVSFTYPNAKLPIIDEMSFSAKKGQTLAFVGSIGSGKTSIINLIQRFYKPSKGLIQIDGVDIRQLDLSNLYRIISVVSQKNELFNDTIRNNIRLANEKATDEEIYEVLKTVQLYDFVKQKTGGLDYMISRGGSNLSGGQRQRLCIARALIRNPEIILLDDSFSALDYRTARMLRTQLNERYPTLTKIIVSQRIADVFNANEIIVVDNGKIIGRGSHKHLMETCLFYRNLALARVTKLNYE